MIHKAMHGGRRATDTNFTKDMIGSGASGVQPLKVQLHGSGTPEVASVLLSHSRGSQFAISLSNCLGAK